MGRSVRGSSPREARPRLNFAYNLFTVENENLNKDTLSSDVEAASWFPHVTSREGLRSTKVSSVIREDITHVSLVGLGVGAT